MGNCLHCNKEVPPKKNCFGKYCNNACQAAHTTQKVIDAFLADPSPATLYSGGQIRKGIRKYFIVQADSKCSLCQWGEINPHSATELPPLEVDHTDGNWQNCIPSNLRVICPNCHSLTATYRGRNKGNGREYRRNS